MLTETSPRKRGPEPQGFVDLKIAVTPELNDMLNQLAHSSSVSKSALVRHALAQYGEALGLLTEGTTRNLTPTRTRRPGTAHNRKE